MTNEVCEAETPRRHRVLIVDDTPTNIEVLYKILHGEYDVFFAKNGPDGLKVVQRELPDLILLDVMMPGMDGYQVCTLLKANPLTASIPVIFITAMASEEDQTKGLDCGAIDYLTKPISPPIVRARVRNHLELKRSRDALEALGRELTGKNLELKRLAREDGLTGLILDGAAVRVEGRAIHGLRLLDCGAVESVSGRVLACLDGGAAPGGIRSHHDGRGLGLRTQQTKKRKNSRLRFRRRDFRHIGS